MASCAPAPVLELAGEPAFELVGEPAFGEASPAPELLHPATLVGRALVLLAQLTRKVTSAAFGCCASAHSIACEVPQYSHLHFYTSNKVIIWVPARTMTHLWFGSHHKSKISECIRPGIIDGQGRRQSILLFPKIGEPQDGGRGGNGTGVRGCKKRYDRVSKARQGKIVHH